MLLKNKNSVIFGVLNKWSIAWAIARAFDSEGARIALSYYRGKENVLKLSRELKNSVVYECDVTDDASIKRFFENVSKYMSEINVIVHSVAFAKAEDFKKPVLYTSRDGYHIAQDVSSYSLIAVSREAFHYMKNGGSIMALTYLGGFKVVPGYNVMGMAKAALDTTIRYLAHDLGKYNIRVNGISAGPIKTAAARGIGNIDMLINRYKQVAPLKKEITQEDVAGCAVFLASHLSEAITGEIIFVDCGYHIMGV